MDANAFRHFYEYHFAQNRKVWDEYITPLTHEQFTQASGYSRGSVRNQLLHIIDCDETWFCQLRRAPFPEPYPDADHDDRAEIRAYWDGVETMMRAYLTVLRDDMLFIKPFDEGEDKDLILWQVLLHVANHGTDHRAQLLRQLNDMGVKTVYQDYIFYVYDHLL